MEIQGISDEDKAHTESTMTVDSSDDSMSFSRVLISGAGFLADSYDLFVINIAVDLMSKVSYDQELTTTLKSQVSLFHIVMSYSPHSVDGSSYSFCYHFCAHSFQINR
jgi:hypothetical protein